MKVIILLAGKHPGHGAATSRVLLYQKGLIENNIDTIVLSNYKQTNGILGQFIWRTVSPFILFYRLLKLSQENKIILAFRFPLKDWIAIWLATRIKGIKLVYELNEKHVAAYGNRFTELKLVKWIKVFVFERFYIRLADAFIVISENFCGYLKNLLGKKVVMIKIPIIIDSAETKTSSLNATIQKPFLLHSGSLSERKDGIIGVFKAFALANIQLGGELHFYLTEKIAPPEVTKTIEEIISTGNLREKIHFLGIISKPELIAYQHQCSMLILNKPDNEQNKYNFSTKLGEYLVHGKPVIYTPVGEMTNYLKDKINAFEVPVGDYQKLSETIVYIIRNQEEVRLVANRGKKLADEEFNYRYQGERLAAFFQNMLLNR